MSDVLRWVCDQYRRKLLAVDESACHEVDLVMARAGQNWVFDETVIDPDELVTAQDIEQRFGVREFAVRDVARRRGVAVRGKRGKSNLYRLGDVLAARAGEDFHKKIVK